MGTLCPHCSTERLDERLHRWQLPPPGQRRYAGRSRHHGPQADGLEDGDLSGTFPKAQLNKASEIGLRSGLDRRQGEAMNYEDCAILLLQRPHRQQCQRLGLRHDAGLYGERRSGGRFHRPAEQPAGSLCRLGEHGAALCPPVSTATIRCPTLPNSEQV